MTSTTDSRRPFSTPSPAGKARQTDEVAFMAASGNLRPVGDEFGRDWDNWGADVDPRDLHAGIPTEDDDPTGPPE